MYLPEFEKMRITNEALDTESAVKIASGKSQGEKLDVSAEDAALRCLMVVRNGIEDATINLKSPIMINPAKKLAGQVVLDEDYPVRATLA
ncbi:MAG: flagellar assembly protein FliW, partial [Oscillospiraceae bacterium]|nr:flagellar assembly protein FliW [Oscillospiraceae bacterium]